MHRICLRFRYGKYSHWRYLDAEKKVVGKIPCIDSLFTKHQRKECFMKGFNSDKLLWYDLSGGVKITLLTTIITHCLNI